MGIYSLIVVEDADEIKKLLPKVEIWIKRALTKAPEHTLHSVVSSVLTGNSLLWVCFLDSVPIGIVTTKILTYPASKTILVHLLGGQDIAGWIGEIEKIEKLGRYNGCSGIEIHGRPAWKKLLPTYNTERIILSKEL